MVSPQQALYVAWMLPIVSPTWATQRPEFRSALPPPRQQKPRTSPDDVSSFSSNNRYNDRIAADSTSRAPSGRFLSSNTRRLSDLVRFDFSGSVETHVVGPTSSDDTAEVEEDKDSAGAAIRRPPLFEIGRTMSILVPSLYIGVDYDFSREQRQRRWHGISCLWTRLRFRPTSTLTLDVSRDQSIIVDLPSSTAVQCSWRGLRLVLRTTSSRSKSMLVSVPVLPSRLQWGCCLLSDGDLLDSSNVHQSAADRRSGWLVDAMGQIQGVRSFHLSDHLDARCTLRRRIQWISNDEDVAESTHFGFSVRCRHGSQSSTMAVFAAQLEQLLETSQLRIRHDVAIGNLLHRR